MYDLDDRFREAALADDAEAPAWMWLIAGVLLLGVLLAATVGAQPA